MTLAQHYAIAIRHQRSTRIDSDLNPEFFPGLVYHGTAQTALETLIRQFGQTNQSAYTLTGPYGSGKSTIALLLTGLLSYDSGIRNAALDTINQSTKSLIDESVTYSQGWLQIRSVGGVHAPVDTFWQATLEALLEHPNTLQVAKKYKRFNAVNESELIELWEGLFTEIKDKVDGVLLLADEMGKTLEFINKNKGELHLFQDLAEVLGRIDTDVIFLGLLHQSFSEYAKERGTKLQEEWGKIQGRYSDISYNVSTDETVALLARSIVPENDSFADQTPYVSMTLDAINDSEERKQSLETRLKQCAPLHPLTALILGPLSKRRFSQNERSTFSFLTSREEHSFQMFLQNTVNKQERYSLANLWDYLEINLEHTILGSPDGHAWAEAADAVNRADVSEETRNVLKSIAIINLFGKAANLYATEKVLQAAVGIQEANELDEHLKLLRAASCIVYRKHQSSWVIFEGSDIDIQSELDKQLSQLSDSTDSLQQIKYSQQTIAIGHYHTVGTMRWVEHVVCSDIYHLDIDRVIKGRNGEFANFVLLIKEAEESQLLEISENNKTIAISVAQNAADIEYYAKELYALELLEKNREFGSSLQHDKVAKKEFDSRRYQAHKLLNNCVQDAFTRAEWFIRGEKITSDSISSLASVLAEDVYYHTPPLLNELVNKNKLSGTAVSARKKLFEAMIDFEDEEDLDIEGFPPEKSMYVSCLKNTKLHDCIDGEWCFSTKNIGPELRRLFDRLTNYLKDKKGQITPLSELVDICTDAPFGLTLGVTPIYLLAYLKTLGTKIAYYEIDSAGDFAFLMEPDSDYVQTLQKNPKELAVKYISLQDEEKQWITQLSVYAATLTGQVVTDSLLSVARPLVTSMLVLPKWIKNANHLSDDKELNKRILNVRDRFLQAKDPHALLTSDLVVALDSDKEFSLTERVDRLDECFTVLKQAHDKMLTQFSDTLKAIFPVSDEELFAMCELVEAKSGDMKLKAFAKKLALRQSKGLSWVEDIVSLAVGKSEQNWNQNDLIGAEKAINEYARDFLSIAKAGSVNTSASFETQNIKTVSLVLEEDSMLKTYKTEILESKSDDVTRKKDSVMNTLSGLTEFEKVDILYQLLRDTLKEQSKDAQHDFEVN
ncbi:hypothetical protein L3Q72_05305 [Vibrio sp. JC009]|uniref:hypothetical protein n=1 Tax=Vibrio sp. JC009 TaxID=2912314 RepID=UPI0023AF8405|nr:hypothetical protein [Vibrio sp. JC009]WED22810.1 hypothetical protein L3Q72_05305 [Vibrio sp. JC009]